MKEKRYSISHVQQMINISPAELQKMLKKNARVLHLFKEEKENGKKEVFLDEESLQKLIFIKQLENGARLSESEVCEVIRVPEVESLEACASTERQTCDRLMRTLESVSEEAEELKSKLHGLMIKHDHLIKELNISQAKNITLEKEIGTLRNREAALMGQLRQNAENFHEEELEIRLVN